MTTEEELKKEKAEHVKDLKRLMGIIDKQHALLTSIVVDVDAMRCEPPEDIKDLGIEEENEHWFGDFGDGEDEYGSGKVVCWPNLSILAEKAKELLK